MDPLPIPRTLGGYTLLRRLGTGGTGTVWEATDQAGYHVALKLLHPAIAETDQARQRLIREAKLVNLIPGDGIARVIDFEAQDAQPFVVTELIYGPTLAQMIAQEPLTLEECLHLALQLQDILQRVQGAGIVHRDLKPSNIILSDDGPVLIDFGIAQHETDSRLTQTGKITGTAGFVAPELLTGAPDYTFDEWAGGDWWAWAALLLNSLTGIQPFGVGNPMGIMHRIFQGQPELGELPAPLAQTFLRALAPKVQDRLTPEQLLIELRNDTTTTLAPETILMTPQPQQDTRVMSPPLPVEPEQYNPRRLPSSTFNSVALLCLLGVIPAGIGLKFASIPLLIILALSVLGAAYKWRETRRNIAGTERNTDTLIASLIFPRHLLLGTINLLPGLALGLSVGLTIRFIGIQFSDLGTGLDFTNIGAWWALETPPLLTWTVITAALLCTFATPSSTYLRLGSGATITKLLPTVTLRIVTGLLTSILTFAALALINIGLT